MDFRTEDQDGMCKLLQVRWTIKPQIPPQPWLPCSGCGGLSAFQSSDKIRLNANGRKLDAWLIYRCVTCDKTWNRPIFERQQVGSIDRRILDALHANDPKWIRAETFNLDALRRKTKRIDEFPDYEIVKEVLAEAPGWELLEIEFVSTVPASIRLDRLLAAELNLPRRALKAMQELGVLCMEKTCSDDLKRRIRSGARVTIDPSGCDGLDVTGERRLPNPET